MADRPILFSGPMVRALIDGTKTQTRRVIDFAGIEKVREFVSVSTCNKTGRRVFEMKDAAGGFTTRPAGKIFADYHYMPRFAVGDRLYVREAWRSEAAYDDLSPSSMGGEEPIRYEADGAHQTWGYPAISKRGRFRQGMHMPRWALRLTLAVDDVRVQRLKDISEVDAIAEGSFKGNATGRVFANATSMRIGGDEWRNARDWYADLWDSLNAARGFGWDANPFVVAVTFEVIKQNIDQIELREVPAL